MKVMAAAVVVLCCAGLAGAQWSSDPAENRAIAARSGDQVQPKVVSDGAGGCYISWFDNFAGGYDVRVQHVDPFGFDSWAADGIEICNRSVSSTTDYDLIPLSGGRAGIIFTEDSLTPGGAQQVTYQIVNADGTTRFPAPGVTITTGTAFKANPHMAELSTGEIIAGYSTGSPQTWVFQKLDGNGAPLYPGAGVTVSEASRYLALCDLQPTNDGGFIALWIRGTTSNPITSAKALYAQKYDGTGVARWNGGVPVIVFNTTSVQNGYFPTFVHDGANGAVFAWYEIGGGRNSYIQHILADGSPKFPAPVATTGATVGRIRVSAGLAYNSTTGEYFVASQDTDSGAQGTNRVLAQRISPTGSRLWGNDGTIVIPTNTNQPSFVQCQITGNGCTVVGIDSRSATTGVIFAAGLADDGGIVWQSLASSTIATKSRLTSALVAPGEMVVAFGNGAAGGASDLWAQNIRADGTYGVAPVIRSTSALNPVLCRAGSATLFVDAAGSSPLTIAWTHNGHAAGSGTSDFPITGATIDDAGEYVCTAMNSLGSASATFTVAVCFADFDCSQGVDGDDVIAFFGAWDAGDFGADVTNDGGVDGDDVIAFFSQWDAGC